MVGASQGWDPQACFGTWRNGVAQFPKSSEIVENARESGRSQDRLVMTARQVEVVLVGGGGTDSMQELLKASQKVKCLK